MNDKVKLPKMLEDAFKAYDSAELEFKLVDELDKQVKTDATGLEAKLQNYVTQLDAPELKTLRGTADIRLIKFRGAMNKVAKLNPATRRSADLQEALDEIAAAKAKCPELDKLVAQARTLLDGVKDVRAKADLWEKEKQRYVVRDELDGVRQNADEAMKHAQAGDIDKALQSHQKAKDLLIDGAVKQKMAANEVPALSDVQKIIGRKDGDKQLDAMIKNLDEATQRKVIRVAFQARFGCKLEMLSDESYNKARTGWDGNLVRKQGATQGEGRFTTSDESEKSPDLRRFYKVMAKLPAKHTRENEKMKNFRYRDSDDSASSWAWSKHDEIVMNEGRADKSGVYGCGRPDEMPQDIKDECKPANDKPITYFDWNTAHEVGHTLDAKLGFMTSRSNQSKFAGWREYGGDSSEVAEALIKHYDFDPTYVRNLLKGTAPAIPALRPGVDTVEWNRRKSVVDAHYARMKAGNNPWSSQATAVSLAIDGRVYQQSYDSPSWSSYELAARKEAISGYQFRSPLEWFSELYAAYKSKKLKPGHPAMEWLQRLDSQ
jgi:hypothetical protein